MTAVTNVCIKPEKIEKDSCAPAIVVEKLHKTYGTHMVLNGITLRVKRGETLAILGRSGTGKSVLLKLIIGLVHPDSGSICIQGQNIFGLTVDQLGGLRKKIGFLFQHAALYDSLTVAENVEFALDHHHREMPKSERKDCAQRLLAEVGLKDSLNKMPSDISGGMQKRVGLARALAWIRKFCFSMSLRQDLIQSVQEKSTI